MEIPIQKVVFVAKDVANRIHAETSSKFKVDLAKATKDFYDTPLGKAILLIDGEIGEPGYPIVSSERVKQYILDHYKLIQPSRYNNATYDRVLSYAVLLCDEEGMTLTDLKKRLISHFL